MWQIESESKYSKYLNSKNLIVSGTATRRAFGGRSEIPTPNYGATAPVMHQPHPCQMSKSRLPLKMVVSDVVHRDFGPLQQPSPSPSRFIVTPKKRSSPYDYYKKVVHGRNRTLRNHPIVDEMQKKFNSMYGCHVQNASSATPCPSTYLAHESPMETDSPDLESNKRESCIPKFSTFYKEFLQKQQSEEIKISNSPLYSNTDKYTLIEENESENDESEKDNTNKEKEHYMLAKNFLQTIEGKQQGNKQEDESPSKYSKHKSEEECSSTSSQEYCSQINNFCFSPLLEEKKEGLIPSKSKMISQMWTPKHKTLTSGSKCSVDVKINVLGQNSASNTSEEESSGWFADEDDDEDLN